MIWNKFGENAAMSCHRLLLCLSMIASLLAAPSRLHAEEPAKTEVKTEDKKEPPAKSVTVQPVGKLDEVLAEVKAAKAKMLFLNVWSSGCGSCIEEMPALVNAYQKDFKDNKEVLMLGLSLDGSIFDKAEAVSRASTVATDKGLPYKNLVWTSELDALTDKWKVSSTPYNALISPDGTLLEKMELLPQDAEKAREVIRQKVDAALEKLRKTEETKSAAPAPDEKEKK
jgi:cytochrome c-type biogenesis protein